MRRNQRNMLIVGIVMMMVGIVIGVLAGEDLPIVGTVSPQDDKTDTQASDSAETYYLVPLTDVEMWLTETYPDLNEAVVADIVALQEVVGVDDYRDFVAQQEPVLNDLLGRTQAALIGLDDVTAETDLSTALPAEPEVTACIGIDEDPFAGVDAQVVLYLVVPTEDAGKNIPSTWEAGDPKTGTSMFWTPLRCSPLTTE